MIDQQTLLLFATASLALILAPGPAVTFILATTLRHGRSAGLAATAGIELGNAGHAIAAALGVSAVLAASAAAFTVVKIAGAVWLLLLAVRAWRDRTPGTLAQVGSSRAGAQPADTLPGGGRAAWLRTFRAAAVVGILNPKTALFFVAFLPQFVRPDAGSAWVQLLVLGLVFVAMATVLDSLWALGGGSLRRLLPHVRMLVLDRVSAGVYAVLGVLTLAARRAT